MDLSSENSLVPPVGWFVGGGGFASSEFDSAQAKDFDKNIAAHCKEYGEIGFSFIVYPLGGLHRFHWKPKNNNSIPPRIHLPDLQMKTEFWSKYVICHISNWIDPDSSYEWLAQLSAEHFRLEIEYARYLGVCTVLIELKHTNSPKLAEMISELLAIGYSAIDFCFLLPTNTSSNFGCDDVWTVWRNFRTMCANSRIFVGLTITADLGEEFVNDTFLRRWYAEPLILVHLNYSLFMLDHEKYTIPMSHSQLLSYLLVSCKQRVVLSTNTKLNNSEVQQMFRSVQLILTNDQEIYRHMSCSPMSWYFDVLQSPLQPLSDNLDSTVYQTFEQDVTKYEHYRRAIKAALRDMVNKGCEEIVVYVLGAGRGPLVDASIAAKIEIEKENKDWTMKLVAVEKNRNAFLTLEYCDEVRWKNSVQLIHSDMRSLADLIEAKVLKRPDLIVSELLGSFGDNELSPECLDGVIPILKSNTICIPQSYTNYITPIQSLHLYQNLIDLDRNKNNPNYISTGRSSGEKERTFDRHYVVFMDQFCHLSNTVEPCFEFVHPNSKGRPNSRQAKVHFELNPNCELMGFSGHFETKLYGEISLSTHPFRSTENLFSWFAILFPLRSLLHFERKVEIFLNIERKIDSGGCWYEWNIEFEESDGSIVKSELQNSMGESQYMKLH